MLYTYDLYNKDTVVFDGRDHANNKKPNAGTIFAANQATFDNYTKTIGDDLGYYEVVFKNNAQATERISQRVYQVAGVTLAADKQVSTGVLLARGELMGRPAFQCLVSGIVVADVDKILMQPFFGTLDNASPSTNTKYAVEDAVTIGQSAIAINQGTGQFCFSLFCNQQVLMDYGEGDDYYTGKPFVLGIAISNVFNSGDAALTFNMDISARKFDRSTIVYNGDEG